MNIEDKCPLHCRHHCKEGYWKGYKEAWIDVNKWGITMFIAGLIIGGAIVAIFFK